MAKKNIGSSFDEFLEEEGLLEEATAVAVKRFIAYQLAENMSTLNISKADMARRRETRRSALDRLWDAANTVGTVQLLQSPVAAIGGPPNTQPYYR